MTPPQLLSRVLTRARRSPLARQFVNGLLWLTLGAAPSRAAALLATVLVARILGRETYGELTLARSTVNAFVTVATFGMGRAAAKFVAELLVTDKERVGRIVGLNLASTLISSGLVAVLFFFFADYLCTTLISSPHLTFQVRLCAPLLILTALVGAQIGVLTGFQAYREIALGASISGFLMIPFYALGARYWGLTGATLGFTSGPLLNFLCNSFFLGHLFNARGVRRRFAGCWRETPVLWNFCLPSTLLSLVMSGATWLITICLAREPNGSSEVGIFDAARQIQTAILYLPTLAANIVVPMLSELNAMQDGARYRRTLRANLAINALFTGCLASIGIVGSRIIMSAFGDGFEVGADVLCVLALTSVVMSVANVYASALTALGALWSRFLYTVAWSALAILGTLAFSLYRHGAFAVALAMLLAYVAQTLGFAFRVRTLLRARDQEIQQLQSK